MDLDPSQYGEADRREVDPPIQVETATWSPGGQLDWWVQNGGNGSAAYKARMAGSGGSKLVIFVPTASGKRLAIVPGGWDTVCPREYTDRESR